MNRLIGQAAAQYQPADREKFIKYVQNEPMAAAQLRAPLYEDKVVDFLFSKAEISERASTRAELEADLESEEGHVHGPGCGHDLAAAGQEAGGEEGRGQARQGPVEKAEAKPKPAKPVKDAAPAKPAEKKAASRRRRLPPSRLQRSAARQK